MSQVVSVVLPTYNESGHIVALLRAIHESLAQYEHEIIVVDDASPDGTSEHVKQAHLAYVRLVERSADRGLALSLLCGIEKALGDVVVLMDSDFNHAPHYISLMLDSMKAYDCVVGSRFMKGGRMQSMLHWFGSLSLNHVARCLLGRGVSDYSYGFICVKRAFLMRAPLATIFTGFGDYSFRLLYCLQRLGASTKDIPVANGVRRSGVSKANYLKLIGVYVKSILKVKEICSLCKVKCEVQSVSK